MAHPTQPKPPALLGESEAFRAFRDELVRVAASDATVLLRGESGVGKGLAATALHHASPRAGAPLVTVHLGALSETLVESELFGHEKGAFTDAHQARSGAFRRAEGGTLVLDDVDLLPPLAQVKLLRVLQERVVEPLGAEAPVPIDVRVVATTTRDLARLVEDGEFRADLYFRLDVVPLEVPPLRARLSDLPALAEALAGRIAQRLSVAARPLSAMALERLRAHGWPGNVRELENALERVLVLGAAARRRRRGRADRARGARVPGRGGRRSRGRARPPRPRPRARRRRRRVGDDAARARRAAGEHQRCGAPGRPDPPCVRVPGQPARWGGRRRAPGRGGRGSVRLVLLLLTAFAAPPGDVAELLGRLDGPSAGERRAALAELAREGDPAVEAALESFGTAELRGRRARAELVRRAGRAVHVEGALATLVGDDPEVQRSLLDFLARADLGREGLEARADALEALAAGAATSSLREDAVEALAAFGEPAVERLVALWPAVPDEERPGIARALGGPLAGWTAARERVRASVRAAFGADEAGALALDDDALAELLPAYARGLAEVPGGGESPADLAPLLGGRRHPSEAVRVAARLSLDALLDRLTSLGEHGRRARVLDALMGRGWDDSELLYRRAVLGLRQESDMGPAIAAARALRARHATGVDASDRTWRFYGCYFEAAARIASDEPSGVDALLERAAELVEGLRAERFDLHPQEMRPSSALVERHIGYTELAALVDLLRATAHLAAGEQPASLVVLERLRAMHEGSLMAHLEVVTRGVEMGPPRLETLMARDIAPRQLFLRNPSNPRWPRRRAIETLSSLGRALATVAPWEMVGFDPVPGAPPRLADPLADAARRAPLVELAEKEVLARRGVRNDELPELARRLRFPSTLAFDVSIDLREDGRGRDAIRLAERVLADLDTGGWTASRGWFGVQLAARIQMTIGSAYSDEDEPGEAQGVLLDAERRLAEVERDLEERLGQDATPRERAASEFWLARVRALRSEALTSLAVNANVKLGDVESALGYFEQAFELNQSDFMRVLLACYRARSGRGEDARAELAGVRAAPKLYYNLACTWSLLGEADLALDFLQRDLATNYPSDGALERQKRWARGDPDLEALRGDPRFERLVGAE